MKRSTKKLELNKQSVSKLNPASMNSIAGGIAPTSGSIFFVPTSTGIDSTDSVPLPYQTENCDDQQPTIIWE